MLLPNSSLGRVINWSPTQMEISFHSDNNARLSVDFNSVRQALKPLKSSEENATQPLKIGRII